MAISINKCFFFLLHNCMYLLIYSMSSESICSGEILNIKIKCTRRCVRPFWLLVSVRNEMSCQSLATATAHVVCLCVFLARLAIRRDRWATSRRSTCSSPPPTACWACCSLWPHWTPAHTPHPTPPSRSCTPTASTEIRTVSVVSLWIACQESTLWDYWFLFRIISFHSLAVFFLSAAWHPWKNYPD